MDQGQLPGEFEVSLSKRDYVKEKAMGLQSLSAERLNTGQAVTMSAWLVL